MALNSWIIKSWPIVDYLIDVPEQLHKSLSHMSTQMSQEPDEFGCNVGHTLWAIEDNGQKLGIAWDWTEMLPGVPVLTDPMRLITNLAFIADDGTVATESRSAVELNRIVRALPWQMEVCKEIRTRSSVKPVARQRTSQVHPAAALRSPANSRSAHLSF